MTSQSTLPAGEIQRPLAESIAAATRSVHAKLNKLIIARLPLAIPPQSANPSIYVSGLLHIAPIYITFESLWKEIADLPRPVEVDASQPPLGVYASNVGPSSNHRAGKSEHVHSLLASLYFPGLMRSDRLRSDIASLTGWSSEVVDEHLKSVATSGPLSDFVSHVQRIVEKKPHVLLAYSYILFMALFAGGRFIRATLESAGHEFWERVPSPIPPTQTRCQQRRPSHHFENYVVPGPVDLERGGRETFAVADKHSRHSLPLSFFHFATPLDGEDLKKEFKRRLAESEDVLTPRQRNDIVHEAKHIFDSMLQLVFQLDDVCETPLDEQSTVAAARRSSGSRTRARDSVAVARERRSRAPSRDFEDDDGKKTWLCKHEWLQKSKMGEDAVPSVAGVQPPACCPASKSMRFEAELPVPDRGESRKAFTTDGAADVPFLRMKTPARPLRALIHNIIIVAGLAAIVGMFFLTSRPVDRTLELGG
ncbi:Heme-binding protein HMX1 [Colletotrichum spinosum]|uniref:Heme-binding protein HMX1 n=1 Tax=Colletotrichum spinosum TaxID=1347390 RepID=A0A4R8PW50_9PEZI|nr:Heme-binding protein HMX1 [Colletotrichum spinosum]